MNDKIDPSEEKEPKKAPHPSAPERDREELTDEKLDHVSGGKKDYLP